ncbi:hypothetical protein COO60DRAFT_1582175, partial [Scenedesmus sp. NREL 46B-D3]
MDWLTSLPPEVLQRLLSKLDQTTLIGVLPSVCKRLRTQAATVAASVSVELRHCRAGDNFAAWVAKHGHTALASLELRSAACIHVQLPFAATPPHLQQLMLAGGVYKQNAIRFDLALQLTSLEITGIKPDFQLLRRIAVLTNLQSLTLHNIDSGPLIDAASRQSMATSAQLAWSHLTRLTALSCTQCDLHDAAVAGLTQSLTRLQRLDLSGNLIQRPVALLPLPPALTSLSISHNHQHLDVSQILAAAAAAAAAAVQDSTGTTMAADSTHDGSSSSRGIGTLLQEQQNQLGGLRHLEISGLALSEPHLLAGLASLTQLVAQELKVDKPPLLLEALASLSSLRHLELRGVFRTPSSSVAEPASLSLALTDKPHLSYLDFGQNRIYELGAADGPGASLGTALMSPPWQLPALQVHLLAALSLCTSSCAERLKASQPCHVLFAQSVRHATPLQLDEGHVPGMPWRGMPRVRPNDKPGSALLAISVHTTCTPQAMLTLPLYLLLQLLLPPADAGSATTSHLLCGSSCSRDATAALHASGPGRRSWSRSWQLPTKWLRRSASVLLPLSAVLLLRKGRWQHCGSNWRSSKQTTARAAN